MIAHTVLIPLLIAAASAAVTPPTTTHNPDPCVNYFAINGTTRDRQIVTSSGEKEICDEDLIPGWYRFTDGEVATSKVGDHHCGTRSTIWMNDRFPKPGMTENKKFCYNHMTFSPSGCLWSEMVTVKNCGQYIVYKLPLKNMLCPMAICTDTTIKPCPSYQKSYSGFTPCDKIRCPHGKWSRSGFEPCRDPYPTVDKKTVTLSPPLESLDFKHVCSFIAKENSTTSRFNVTFNMDGVPVSHVVVAGHQREAYFEHNQWEGHINKHLTCSVESFFSDIPDHLSPKETSNSYHGKIEINPSFIHLQEDKDEPIEVVSTLPVFCENKTLSKPCLLSLSVDATDLFTVEGCDVVFTPEDWDNSTKIARTSLTIASVVDPVVKPQHSTKMYLRVSDTKTTDEAWRKATVNPLRVSVQDRDMLSCTSTGDPRILSSFSPYTHGRYDLYHIGDFNYASDTRVPIAVQIESNDVGYWIPSTMAVAVQIEDDVIIIDTQHGTAPPSVKVNNLSAGRYIQSCGTGEFQISHPKGHRINVYHRRPSYRHYLDLTVSFPVGAVSISGKQYGMHSDVFNISKLYHEACHIESTTDGLPTLTSGRHIGIHAIDYYRVRPEHNLFTGKKVPMKQVHVHKKDPGVYCWCQPHIPGKSVCMFNQKQRDPLVMRSGCRPYTPSIAKVYRKVIPPTNRLPQVPHWPVGNINETYARQRCRTQIMDYSTQQCKQFTHSLDHYIDVCMDDVLASSGFTLVSSAVHGFHADCIHKMMSNITNYKTTQHGGPVIKLEEPCPNYCNTRGACVKGVCHCYVGWEWDDCSVEAGKDFEITEIDGGQQCDRRVEARKCFQPRLSVHNLGTVTECTVQTYTYLEGKVDKEDTNYTVNFTRVNGNTLSCDLSSANITKNFTSEAFRIYVSARVGDRNQTDSILYTLYDGTCQKCEDDFTCYQREDACLIDGVCYQEGHNATVGTKDVVCNPRKDLDGWTPVN